MKPNFLTNAARAQQELPSASSHRAVKEGTEACMIKAIHQDNILQSNTQKNLSMYSSDIPMAHGVL